MRLLNVAELHRSTGGQGRDYERYVLHFSPEYLKAISTPQSNLLAFFSGGPRYRLLNEEELAGMVDMLEKCRRPIRHFGDDIRREKAFAEVLLALCELFGDENQPWAFALCSFARIAPIPGLCSRISRGR